MEEELKHLEPPPLIQNPARYKARCEKCGSIVNKHGITCITCQLKEAPNGNK